VADDVGGRPHRQRSHLADDADDLLVLHVVRVVDGAALAGGALRANTRPILEYAFPSG